MTVSEKVENKPLVLIVDDQEINRYLLGYILDDAYEVITAENGAQALELIRGHEKELSVVLLDLMMPVMNGYEVIKNVRGDDALRKIPIIVMTADDAAQQEALHLGAADFITKPFDSHDAILECIGRVIKQRKE